MSTNRYIDKLKARLAKEADQRMQLQALLDDQVARNRAILAEQDALRKDAERYRWLREQEAVDGMAILPIGKWVKPAMLITTPFDSPEMVDSVIDAALQGDQP